MNLQNKPIEKTWTFASSSNPSKTYETILYTDGDTSCNCRGWTFKKEGQERTCTHTRKVESGQADNDALSVWTPNQTQAQPPVKTTPVKSKPKKSKPKLKDDDKPTVRKIQWK